jgi:signal transduction histidine kinase
MEPDKTHHFYTALLAHDISNFNQTTRGYLEMLLAEQMGTLSEEQNRVLTTCLRQCRRIQSLVDSIRLLERLENEPPKIEPVELDAAIKTAIVIVQQEFSEQDIRVRFTPARRVVLAEPTLQDVVRQLIGNAARHSNSEVVEVDLNLEQTEEDPPMWRIIVRDNGDGVAMAKREHIFTRLESGQVHGSGVGLSLAAILVKRWSGKIWLEDTPPGQGAVFGLELPAKSS